MSISIARVEKLNLEGDVVGVYYSLKENGIKHKFDSFYHLCQYLYREHPEGVEINGVKHGLKDLVT